MNTGLFARSGCTGKCADSAAGKRRAKPPTAPGTVILRRKDGLGPDGGSGIPPLFRTVREGPQDPRDRLRVGPVLLGQDPGR